MNNRFAWVLTLGIFSTPVRSKEAIAKCEYMARDRIDPCYMYGPIGSGKTSILRRITERLSTDKRYTVAYVIAANVRRPNTFLKVIMEAFDVQTARSYDAWEVLLIGELTTDLLDAAELAG